MEGWIKVYRQMLDNPIVCKDSDHIAVWIYLLLNATHTEYDTLFKGKRTTLQKGQLITGIISISKKLKINKDKVQRILKRFEIDKQIEQQTSNKNRLITILNWDKYQIVDKQFDKQMINNCKTTDKQVITNKNINNIKNEKNVDKYNNLVETYNFNCPNLPKVQKITDKRKTAINKFLKEYTKEQFIEICKIANNNDFLMGKNDRGWKADFDFLMRVDKATSILEGKYGNITQNENNVKATKVGKGAIQLGV